MRATVAVPPGTLFGKQVVSSGSADQPVLMEETPPATSQEEGTRSSNGNDGLPEALAQDQPFSSIESELSFYRDAGDVGNTWL